MEFGSEWMWKKINGDSQKHIWVGKKDNNCWGLVVGTEGNKKGKWRWFKGEVKGEKCKFEVKNKGIGYEEKENGKWTRLQENVSVSLDK